MKIAIIPNLTRSRAISVTTAACKELCKSGIAYCFSSEIRELLRDFPDEVFEAPDRFIKGADMVISVGGDGSMLRAAKLAAEENKNVLGINAGRLAYLCGLDSDELHLLSRLKDGMFTVQKRMMLQTEIYSHDELIYSAKCLNDAVFNRGAYLRLIDLSVKTGGRDIADYLADGAIFATPTGSTAYSMSAGGPIIDPKVRCFALTPICSHSLTARPIIVGEDSRFVIRLPKGSEESAIFSLDGRFCCNVDKNVRIEIEKAPYDALLINLSGNAIYKTLSLKF